MLNNLRKMGDNAQFFVPYVQFFNTDELEED